MTDYLLRLRQWTEDLQRISNEIANSGLMDSPLDSFVYQAAQEAERLLEDREIQEVRIIKLKGKG